MCLGSFEYGSGCDVWSSGCIIAELFLGFVFLKSRPPVNQQRDNIIALSDMEQLSVIFKVFGVPTKEDWEGVECLPGVAKGMQWNDVGPMWKTMGSLSLTGEAVVDDGAVIGEKEWWERLFERVVCGDEKGGSSAVDLVRKLCRLDPRKRMSAGEALKHEYFRPREVKLEDDDEDNKRNIIKLET